MLNPPADDGAITLQYQHMILTRGNGYDVREICRLRNLHIPRIEGSPSDHRAVTFQRRAMPNTSRNLDYFGQIRRHSPRSRGFGAPYDYAALTGTGLEF